MKKNIFIFGMFAMLIGMVSLFTGCPNNVKPKENGKKVLQKEKILIDFDAALMECKQGKNTFAAKSEAEDGAVLIFTAKLAEGESVKEWLINGKKAAEQTNTVFNYTVKKVDAKTENGKKVIAIGFTKNEIIPKDALEIKFDGTISCTKNSAKITSGSFVKEGELLVFTAKLAEGESVKEWLINGKKAAGQTNTVFNYTVKKADAKTENGKKVIAIGFTKNNPLPPPSTDKVFVKFDSAKMKCEIDKGSFLSDWKDLPDGSEINDGDSLRFTALVQESESVDEWFLNDAVQTGQTNSQFKYKVKFTDSVEKDGKATINVRYTKKILEFFYIDFDAAKMECKKGTEPVTSGRKVYEKTALTFSAVLNTGESIENWYINDDKQPNSYKTFTYTVKAADAKDVSGKKTIKISYKLKSKVTIRFKPAEIKCEIDKGGFLSDWKDLPDGAEVNDGDSLRFTALVQESESVDEWFLNDAVQTGQTNSQFKYKVKFTDSVEKDGKATINVRYTKKTLEFFYIDFDAAKMECKKGTEPVTSGRKVYEKTTLTFSAVLNTGESIENWYINDDKQPNSYKTFTYTVKTGDAKDVSGKQTIKISYKLKKKAAVKFDSTVIKCVIQGGLFSSDTPVNSDTEVNEGETLLFTALLAAGESVEKWAINGIPKDDQTNKTFSYKVSLSDIDSSTKVITVSYSKKSLPKANIEFNQSKISCKRGAESLNPNSEIYEGDKLVFTAVLAEGISLEKWSLNNIEKTDQTRETFYYTVAAADFVTNGSGNKITVAYTEKTLDKFTIEFDETKMTCKKGTEPVTNGSEVYEKTALTFSAVLNTAESIENWYINDNKQSASYQTFTYKVKTGDAKDVSGKKTIKISYKLKSNVIIKFNSAEVKCEIDKGSFLSDWKDIADGSEVNEGSSLRFTALVAAGETVEKWFLNDNERTGETAAQFKYKVKLSDAVKKSNKDTIEIKYTKTSLKAFYIDFDTAKMECKKGTEPVTNGSEVYEKTALMFSAVLNTAESIENWYINDAKQSNSSKTFTYTVKAADAQMINGKQTIRISYKLKQKVIIKFDSSVIKCQKGSGWSWTNLTDGAEVDTGTRLWFEAQLGTGEKVVNWLFNNHEVTAYNGKKSFYYTVSLDNAVDSADGKKVIEVKMTKQ